MKILLVSFENTLVCFGIRMISSMLKRRGFTTGILFLPREFNQMETPDEIDRIVRWVEAFQPDVIGFSLMSSHIPRAVPVNDAIRRKLPALVVWGGIHPTLRPAECLEHADAVCIGEGEFPMLELVENLYLGKPVENIRNFWFNNGESVIKNPVRPRLDNLDALPWPDHDETSHWIHFDGEIQHVNDTIWRNFIPGFMDTHYVMSSRGCPHNCTYCCNSALRKVAEGPYLRRRSPEHFIGELEAVKAKFHALKGFVFMDDSFFYGNDAWFREFCALYESRIRLPFFCWANPSAVTEERIHQLTAAGLVGVHVGLESGSPRISNDVYHRYVSEAAFFQCMDALHKHRKDIVDIRVDVITDNPYESEADTAKTVEILSRLKKPFFVGIVSLIFYPQTELELRAIQDGIIQDGDKDLYLREFFHYRPTLLNRLMRCTPMTPGWLVRFFLRIRKHAPGRLLFYLYYFGYFIMIRRKLRALRRLITLWYLKHYEDKIDPKKVVTTRVSLIDF